MFHRRFPVVAQEGVPLLLALIAVAVILAQFVGGWYAVLPLAPFVVLVLLCVFCSPIWTLKGTQRQASESTGR